MYESSTEKLNLQDYLLNPNLFKEMSTSQNFRPFDLLKLAICHIAPNITLRDDNWVIISMRNNAKLISCSVLVLKICAFLNWNLDLFCDNLPNHYVMLISILLLKFVFKSEDELDVPFILTSEFDPTEDSLELFAKLFILRWIFSCRFFDNKNKGRPLPKRDMFSDDIPLFYYPDMYSKLRQTFFNESSQFLSSFLYNPCDLSMPTRLAFSQPSETSKIEHLFDQREVVTITDRQCQILISMDIARVSFLACHVDYSFRVFHRVNDLYKEMTEEGDKVFLKSFPVEELRAYIRADECYKKVSDFYSSNVQDGEFSEEFSEEFKTSFLTVNEKTRNKHVINMHFNELSTTSSPSFDYFPFSVKLSEDDWKHIVHVACSTDDTELVQKVLYILFAFFRDSSGFINSIRDNLFSNVTAVQDLKIMATKPSEHYAKPSFVIVDDLLWSMDFDFVRDSLNKSLPTEDLVDIAKELYFLHNVKLESEGSHPKIFCYLIKSLMAGYYKMDYDLAGRFITEALRLTDVNSELNLQLLWHKVGIDCRFSIPSYNDLISLISSSRKAELYLKYRVFSVFLDNEENFDFVTTKHMLSIPGNALIYYLVRVLLSPESEDVKNLVTEVSLLFMVDSQDEDQLSSFDLNEFISYSSSAKLLTPLGSLLIALYVKNKLNVSSKITYPLSELWGTNCCNDSINISLVLKSVHVFFRRMHHLHVRSWYLVETEFMILCEEYRLALKNYCWYIATFSEFFHSSVLPYVLTDSIVKGMIKCCNALKMSAQMAVLTQFLSDVDYSTCFAGIGDINGLEVIDIMVEYIYDVNILEFIHGVYVMKGRTKMADYILKYIRNKDLSPFNSDGFTISFKKLKVASFFEFMFKITCLA